MVLMHVFFPQFNDMPLWLHIKITCIYVRYGAANTAKKKYLYFKMLSI